jgi:hypothetical protein
MSLAANWRLAEEGRRRRAVGQRPSFCRLGIERKHVLALSGQGGRQEEAERQGDQSAHIRYGK